MYHFNWIIIIPTTLLLYLLIIVSLPFSTTFATIMLFSLIGFWSRLPGHCINEPVRILYVMDLIDIFAVIIAMYVSPFQAAVFALVWNIFPWICGGGWLNPIGSIKDGVTQAILCFFVPLFFAMSGSLTGAVLIFSVVRIPLFLLISVFIPHRPLGEQIFHALIASVAVIIVNIFYTKLFGNFFSNLLRQGASFSWALFLIATAVIIIFSVFVFGVSPKNIGKRITGHILNSTKKNEQKQETY